MQDGAGELEPAAETLTDPEAPDGDETPLTDADELGDGDEPEHGDGDVSDPAGLRDERAIDKAYDALRREGARHDKRVAEILGADFAELAPCPLCSHFAAGFLGLVELPAEAIPTMRALLGMPDLTTYVDADDASTCPSCSGRGSVLTGSSVPGYETKQCRRCAGIGWVGPGAPVPPTGLAPSDDGVVTGPTVYEAPVDDPAVADLKARGFTVIPPMRLEP